jgi:hypothetical protein
MAEKPKGPPPPPPPIPGLKLPETLHGKGKPK